MSTPDRDLARRLLEGDPEALDEFFADHVPRLYRFALRRVGGRRDAAEEVAQVTLVRAIEKLETFRGEAALSTWLRAICRRVIEDTRTRDWRESPLTDADREFRATPEAGTVSDDPEAELLREENARRVHTILDDLPEPYGEILEWKYIEGLPVKEIARRLATSPKAAESMLTRGPGCFPTGVRLMNFQAGGQRR